MIPLFVSKDREKGTLIFASSDLKYLKKMTEKYFENNCIHREFIIDVVVGIEPINKNNNNLKK